MFTAEEVDIDKVREVAGESSYTFISSLIDQLNDSQWERALDFIAEWDKVAPGDLIALSGGRDGVQLSDQQGLDDIRKRMRLLLGLPELRTSDMGGGSIAVLTEARW